MKRVILFIMIVVPLILNAQQDKLAEVFCAVDNSVQNAIRIKWLYKTVYHPGGFDIYRQEKGGSEWVKLNSDAIKPTKVLPASNNLDKEAKDLHKAMVESSFEEFSTSIIRAFVLIKAIYENELADFIGVSFLDKAAQNNREYQYKVCLAGSTEPLGISKPFVFEEFSLPGCPEGVKLIRSKKRVDISWKPDIYRYYAVDVYRRSDIDTSLVKLTKVPRAIQKEQADKYSENSVFYQDTAIDYNANYYYRFKAIDYFGQSSGLSSEFSAPAADFIPPAQPFSVTPTSSSLNLLVRLDWKVIDEKDLAGVNIYWSNSPDKKYEKVNKELIPKTTLTYNHTSVPVGSNYYWVATVDLAGNESVSPPVFTEIRDVTPPAKPTGLESEAGEGFINLKWKANSEPDLKGYHVQRSLKIKSDIGSSYINVTKEPIVQTNYSEKLPKNVRNEFVYRVVAIDTNFNRSIPSDNTLAKMPDVTPPLQPVIKSASADTANAKVSWLANADADLAGYNLFTTLSGDTLTMAKVNFNLIPSDMSTYTDRDIKPGSEYDYYLVAVDSSGNSSEKSQGFGCKTPEKKITGTVKIDSKNFNVKKGLLKLEWTARLNEDVKGYVVYMQVKPDLPFKPVTGMLTDNYADISVNDNVNGLFYIKCYTVNGKIVQSETFGIQNEKKE